MRPRVLLVDDDSAILRMLVRTLEAEGYETDAASDGATALVRAEASVPDVIVLDVAMPGMDGLAVSRRLREKGQRVPILFLTARDAVSDRVAGLDAGGDDIWSSRLRPTSWRHACALCSGAVVPAIGSRTAI